MASALFGIAVFSENEEELEVYGDTLQHRVWCNECKFHGDDYGNPDVHLLQHTVDHIRETGHRVTAQVVSQISITNRLR